MKTLTFFQRVALALGVGGTVVGAWLYFAEPPAAPPRAALSVGGGAPLAVTMPAVERPSPAGPTPALVPAPVAPTAALGIPILPQPLPGTVSAQFFDWLRRYLEAAPAERPALVAEGVRLAAARRVEFKNLIASDPRRALEEAVPMAVRALLPAEVLAQLEERVNQRAELRVYQGTPPPGEPLPEKTLTHRIADFGGEKAYVAHVYGARAEAVATMRNDSLNGVAVDNQFAVNEEPARVLEAGELPNPAKPVATACPVSGLSVVAADVAYEPVPADTTVLETPEQTVFLCGGYHKTTYYTYLYAEGGTGGPTMLTGILPAAPTPALGVAKILYIPMTFADQNAIPATESKCYEVMRDVADYYAKSSFGRLSTLTTVTPPVKLPRNEAWYVQKDTSNGGTVDGLGLELTHARDEAKKLGFDWNDYDCTVLRLNGGPRVTGGWGGGGQVWIYSDSVGVTAHEIGHSFGLGHANYWDTAGTSAIGAGTNAEYGDIYDVMGSGGVPTDHYNAQAKNQIKWLPSDYISDITASGLYRVHAFDQPVLDPANRYAIKIVKDSQRTYWGEVRQLYNGSASRPWADKGLLLGWRFPNGSGGNIQRIDTTPGSLFGKDDAAISLGRTFSDLESGIHLTTVAVSATTPKYVDLVVNFGAFPANTAPTLSLSASADVVPVGATVNFTATAADADADALAYSWQHFGDANVKIVSPNAPAITRTFGTAGTYVVGCTVSDMKGGSTTRTKLITVGNGNGRFTIAGRITADGLGLAEVIVNANGANSVVTDSDGYYVIPNLTATTYTMTALLYGYTFSEVFNNSVAVGPNFTGADFVADATPRLSLAASIPTASEAGPAAGRFTITRTGDTSQPLLVNVNAPSGTAILATDYAFAPASVAGSQGFVTFTIPADQATLDITVTPVNDTGAEGPETVILQLGPGNGYLVSSAASARVTIDDNDTTLPKISVAATAARIAENGGQPAVLTFTRTGATTAGLTVDYAIGGTAGAGGDFTALPGSVLIPAGSASAAVDVAPVNDNFSEPVETVILTTTSNAAYLLEPAALTATATIVDDDVQILSVTATDAVATELDLSGGAPADTGTFLVTRTGDLSQPLTIYYSLSGQLATTPALHGVDYEALPGVLVIPAGSAKASITITPRWDNLGEGPETVVLSLGAGSTNYQLSPTSSNALVTIADGAANPVYLEVIATAGATEPGTNGNFRLSARGAGTVPITVNYTISGTATAGSDYNITGLDTVALTGTTTITLNNGTVVKDLSVTPVNDAFLEELENITLTITPNSAYTTYGPTSAATMWMRDDDRPTVFADVHVTTNPPSIAENGGTVSFYLSRTGSTASSLTVNYTLGGTATAGSGGDYAAVSGVATIPAGALGVDVTLTLTDDAVFEGTEMVILSLAAGSYARGADATLYLLDGETSTQRVAFTNTSAAGQESATPVNIPVSLTSAATAPVSVEYLVESGARSAATTTATTITPPLTLPYWVRVVRTGTSQRNYYSTDGATWVQHGTTQTISLPSTSYLAGLAVSGGASGSSATATIDNLTINGLEAGGTVGAVTSADIGSPNPAGSNSESSGLYTITAGGPDLATGTTDAFRYVYFPVSNSANCTITARIATLTGGAVSAKAGVMLRESTASNARHNTTLSLRDSSVRATYRLTTGASGLVNTSTTIAKPWWIRLQRAGNVFSAFSSSTGTGWVQLGSNQTLALSSEVLAGLAVSSKSDGQLSTATFDNITLTPGPLPALSGRTVGFVDAQGSDSLAGSIQTIAGSGVGVGVSNQDECHFLSAPVSGDFILTARLLTQTGGASTAQAGVMIRETAGFRARMLYLGSVANSGLEFITRATTVTNSFGTGVDYTLAAGTLNFAIGESTRDIVLGVANDSLPEPDEEITVILRNSNGAQLGTNTTFTYTIIDDDATAAVPTIGFASAASTQLETAGSIAIPVSLSVPSASAVNVDYAITAGTATGGSDFTLAAGTLTIPPGETIGTISVALLDDALVESPETVLVTLSNPSPATLGSVSSHTLTISDNEFPIVTIAATDAAASESGLDPGTFTLTRAGSTAGTLVVAFTRTGTAASGSDFSALATTVSIPDGQSSAILTVTPLQDTSNEGNETVVLTLSANAAYTVGTPASATVTIADDDRSTVSIAASDPAASETPGNPGQFLVTRTAPTTGTLAVSLTITGTATNGADYTSIASFTFAANEASRAIAIAPVNDTTTEGDEQVTVQLSAGSYFIGGDGYANVNIADNDNPPTLFVSSPTAQGPLIATGNGLIVAATVTDDGAPQPVTVAWSQASGPGIATFATPTAASSAVTFSADGAYVLRITASDGQFTVSDTVTIIVGASITPAEWTTHDLNGTVAQRGLSLTQAGVHTLTGIGAGYAATTADGAHLMARQITGDASVVARLTALTGPAAAPLAGVTIRDGLSRSSRRAVLGYVPGTGVQFRYRTTATTTDSVATAAAAAALPLWLKLERNATTGEVTASQAPDAGGSPGAWSIVGSPIVIAVDGATNLGLTATGNTTASLTTATFDNLALTPAASGPALIAEDFGTGTPTGTFAENAGTYTIAGSGSMDGSGAFYGRQYHGDLMVTAKLVDATSGAVSAKSGLMIREGMDTNAGYAFLGRIPTGSFSGFTWRTFAAGTGGGVPSFTGKVRWMRLIRRGNSITALHAADVSGAPGAWVQLGQPRTVIMSTAVLVGFAVDNAGGTGLNTAIFNNLSIVALNKAPIVEAGNFAASAVTPVALAGTVTDDNFPTPPSLVSQWSALAGPAAVSFANPAAPTTSATFTADGAYTLRLRASDGSAETFDDVTLTAYTSAFAQWQGANFPGGSANPDAAAAADIDRDGLTNLFEYATNTAPTTANVSPVVTDTVTIGPDKFLRLTVPKNPAATDVTYQVQGTADLAAPLSWSAAGLVIELNNGTTLRVRDNIPLGSPAPPAHFLRVFVSKP